MSKKGVTVFFLITAITEVEIVCIPEGWQVRRILPHCFVFKLLLIMKGFMRHRKEESSFIRVISVVLTWPRNGSESSKDMSMLTLHKSNCCSRDCVVASQMKISSCETMLTCSVQKLEVFDFHRLFLKPGFNRSPASVNFWYMTPKNRQSIICSRWLLLNCIIFIFMYQCFYTYL